MPDVIVVGAGIAGLRCASELQRAGLSVRVFEAADRPGGRMTTDDIDGFVLDRGFQVLLPAYPTAGQLATTADLNAHPMASGMLAMVDGRLHPVLDPQRHPAALPGTLSAPVGEAMDKLRLAALGVRSRFGVLRRPPHGGETTAAYLSRLGFSPTVVDRLFRPFLAGVFFERELATPAAVFVQAFDAFTQGGAWLPDAGIRALPELLANRLALGTIEYGTRVQSVDTNEVRTEDGRIYRPAAVVLAVDPWSAAHILGEAGPQVEARGTTCLYFAGQRAPIDEPALVVNADQGGPINNWCVVSNVAPSYAPPGAVLISASTVGDLADDALEEAVRDQFAGWFGVAARTWRLLRTYHLPQSLPGVMRQSARLPQGVWACGDYLAAATLEGAVLSGDRAAAGVLAAGIGRAAA